MLMKVFTGKNEETRIHYYCTALCGYRVPSTSYIDQEHSCIHGKLDPGSNGIFCTNEEHIRESKKKLSLEFIYDA